MRLQFDPESEGKRSRKTIVSYAVILLLLILAFVVAARNVILVPWTTRTRVSAVGSGAVAYLFGGRGADGDLISGILRADFGRNTLRRAGDLPEPALSVSVVAVSARRILLIGGMKPKSVSQSVLVYDPASREVKPLGRLPGPRTFGYAADIGGRILYFGGFDGERTVDSIISIDPQTGLSRIVGKLPVPVEQMGGAVHDGMVYLFGGESSDGKTFDTIYRYDPSSDSIETAGRLPAPASRFTAAAIGGLIILSGGWGDRATPGIYRFDPATKVVHLLKEISRADAANLVLVPAAGSLYLVGGAEARYGREVGIQKVDITTGDLTSSPLRSYAWW